MTKTFGWEEQLDIGHSGEQLLLHGYHEPLVFASVLTYDFRGVTDGRKIELKTDTFSMSETPNFFMERWSRDDEKRHPGGPWRARRSRVDTFVYLFIRDGIYFEFRDIKALCSKLDEWIDATGAKERRIRNKHFVTVGYTVPRDILLDLCKQYKLGER